MRTEQLRAIAQRGKDQDPGWYRMHRRVSIHLTRVALRLGLRPNPVSLGMMAVGVAGAGLLVPRAPALNLLGFAVLYLAFLLDKVDGELARVRGTESARGIFLDRMHHRLIEPLLFMGVALHEYLLDGTVLPLLAGFATLVLGNGVDENQHLAPYILGKRLNQGGRLPAVVPRRSPALNRAAAVLRPLKGFRMVIVAIPMFLAWYAVRWWTGLPAPTWGLAAGAVALGVYLPFQCFYYFREQLDMEAHAFAETLRGAAEAERTAAPRVRPMFAAHSLAAATSSERAAGAAGSACTDAYGNGHRAARRTRPFAPEDGQ